MSNSTNSYTVGFSKPPVSTRFKKGVSGNPRGRPKAAQRKAGALITNVLNRKIEVVEGGKVRRVSIMEAIVMQLARRAAKGDVPSARMLRKLEKYVEKHGEINPKILVMPESDRKL